MKGSREAALTLHALPAADRSWVLERLEPVERRLVQSHLDELAALGIPPDPSLLDEAVSKASTTASPRAVISQASVFMMRSLLAEEPPGVIARLLALGEWRWADELVRELAPQCRQKVQALRGQASGPRSQLDEWLLDELERRIRAALPETAEPAAPIAASPWWARLGLGRARR